jgi:hypothetical protein
MGSFTDREPLQPMAPPMAIESTHTGSVRYLFEGGIPRKPVILKGSYQSLHTHACNRQNPLEPQMMCLLGIINYQAKPADDYDFITTNEHKASITPV